MNKTNTKQKRILIAEDESAYARIYERRLKPLGYEVEIVSNGEALIESVKKELPGVILLDIMMPIKDGFTALEEMRQADILQGVKVLVLSNFADTEHIERAKQLGVNEYIIKSEVPFQDVVEKILTHFCA